MVRPALLLPSAPSPRPCPVYRFAPVARDASLFLASLIALASVLSPLVLSAANAGGKAFVTYEDFGAVGDGVADDLPAIVAAHAHANQHGLPVRSRPDATYHLGRRALTAVITTDTDWSTSRFIIDDTDVEDHKRPLFEVRSRLAPIQLTIEKLSRDQRRLDIQPPVDCWVRVENAHRRRYIRRGLNQNNGTPQHDCFILRRDGSIEGAIDWDYDTITRIEARPIDPTPLHLTGGDFTTIANRMVQEVGYNYWARNIVISRSNTIVSGLTHRVTGETDTGHPYSGFLAVRACADVTLTDCVVSGHRTYTTIGSAGKPVPMGSYDLTASDVVNFTLRRVRMDDICNSTLWGVIGTNFCKNIVLEDCILSRMDVHQGVSGAYTLRRCTLGHMGLKAIGRGILLVEDSTIQGRSFITLRADYGSTWEGRVIIRNSRWIPGCGKPPRRLFIIQANNDGQHDFGYTCHLPVEIRIEGLVIEDGPAGDAAEPVYVLTDPDGPGPTGSAAPHPLCPPETVVVRDLVVRSGRPIALSPDPALAKIPLTH